MKAWKAIWAFTSALVVVGAIVLAAVVAPQTVAGKKWDNSDTWWTKGGTLKVFVDPIPADAPAGTSDAVDEAIREWNEAQAEFGGLRLERAGATKENADIHVSWKTQVLNSEGKECWALTHAKDSVDKGNGFTKDTVRIETDYIDSDGTPNARGITRILKHEFGHAEGLDHSNASELMKRDAYSSTPGKGPSAADLNNPGPFTAPTADDKAEKKNLWGTTAKTSKSETEGTQKVCGLAFVYEYTVRAETVCDVATNAPCTDSVTFFAVEIADSALDDAVLSPPPGWTCELIDGRVSVDEGKPLDDLPPAPSLAACSATASGGISPGEAAKFTIATWTPPGTVRRFTNSPGFDEDEAFVPGPAPGGVGGTAELLVGGSDATASAGDGSGFSAPLYAALAGGIAAAAAAVATGGWYARRRLLR